MTTSFYEQPILNSPYEAPARHHRLDDHGQPVEGPPISERRPSQYVVPVPSARKSKTPAQESLDLETYNENALVNEIRKHVAAWRALPNPADWGVSHVTRRLLEHWRRPHDEWPGLRPFFCQREAIETIIWLTEVAPNRAATRGLIEQIETANQEANPELFRLAMKMATGSGKTTVMAMLIAWQAANAARTKSGKFSRAFLVIAPGITIRDRLRVLLPSEPDNYYATRDLVPSDMLPDIQRAEIVITNYHSFQYRETLTLSKTGRELLQGKTAEELSTKETDAQMLKRACGKLLRHGRINVLNDEAHHCYREKASSDEGKLTGDDRKEADSNKEAARLWISGIEALDRHLKKGNRRHGVRAVYDLSATPFFLRGSGYAEGTLFPWVVSDFSLIDAIECGIVKLPRVPVSDNLPGEDAVLYRELWKHVGKHLPKTATAANKLSPTELPTKLQTALHALYSHYEKEFDLWDRAGIGVPPVFIVVCQNTAISKLVFEWISGFERESKGERARFTPGALPRFRNYDAQGGRLPYPPTLLIDSRQLESGEALDKSFLEAAATEIEQFKRELAHRDGAASVAGKLDDAAILREVMNTVGRKGKLGEQIRCVVSVSMLTEGWDANTVTHIMGVRAFGTQLLCEQVVGRGLRRQSYELNADGLFEPEYADIMGIPFDFASSPRASVPKPPKPSTHVHAMAERADLEIRFPRISGYRQELAEDELRADFTDDSRLTITPEDIGPTSVVLEGLFGEGVTITLEKLGDLRPSEVSYRLAKALLYRRFTDKQGTPKQHLFPAITRFARRWIDEGYLELKGVPMGAILYEDLLQRAVEKITLSFVPRDGGGVLAVADPYNPEGSTAQVNFHTTKSCYETGAQPPKSHLSHVVADSGWEEALAHMLEGHKRVLSYVKNQGLGFEVPYLMDGITHRYLPDFIVRIDNGAEPLNLVLEMKGERREDARVKADTMNRLWVPGVNALAEYGRWAFIELRDPWTTPEELSEMVKRLIEEAQ